MIENKEVMAKNIKFYMEKKHVNATDVCNALGFKHNTFSDWVNAKTYPRIDKIELMANYFGISKALLVEDISVYDLQHQVSVDRLKEALNDNNMSPEDLVNETKISKGYITSYLKGTRQLNNQTSYAISKVLNVSPVWLMGFGVPKHNNVIDVMSEKSFNKEALDFYQKYLEAPRKVQKMIDMLLEEGEE